ALSGQARWAPDGAVLRSRDGQAPTSTLRAAARFAFGHHPRRAPPALPAASQDRRRGLRIRGPAPLAPPAPWFRASHHLHPPRRAEWHDRRDWRMDAARGLPRGRLVERADADRYQPVA